MITGGLQRYLQNKKDLKPALTEEEIEAAEQEIDKKTVTYIFKLKQNNPQINPEIFAKAIEYIRVGSKKKLKLRHYESSEKQMARLYPEKQPEVFSRLWEEVSKRKIKQETLLRINQRQTSKNWLDRLKEVKKVEWAKLLSTKSEFHLDSDRLQYLTQNKEPLSKQSFKFSKNFGYHKISNTASHEKLRRKKKKRDKSTELNPIVAQADLNMINPSKIRESSFITEFVRSHMNLSEEVKNFADAQNN